MQFTNELGLPEPIVRAVTRDPYDRGKSDFSVTQLMSPPRIRILRKRHSHELTEDVSDRIYALLGQSIHTILERADVEGLAEIRLFTEIDGLTISGQLDRAVLIDGLLQDYKITSVYTDQKPEWAQQLNPLKLLLSRNGYEVDKLQIVAIFRDWSKARAKRDENYPQHQVKVFDIPVWTEAETLQFLRDRIKAHTEAEWKLPECTPEERWYRGEAWAVKKKGNKRATKLFDFKDQAEKFAEKDPKFVVEYRPGTNVRCEDYCPVSEFCDFYQKLTEEQSLEGQLRASLK